MDTYLTQYLSKKVYLEENTSETKVTVNGITETKDESWE